MKRFVLVAISLFVLTGIADANGRTVVRSFNFGRSYSNAYVQQAVFSTFAYPVAYPVAAAIYAPAAVYAAPCVQQQVVPPAVPMADTSCPQTAQLFAPSYAPSVSYAPAISYAPAYSAGVGYGVGYGINRTIVRAPIHHRGIIGGTTVIRQRGFGIGRSDVITGGGTVVVNEQRGLFGRSSSTVVSGGGAAVVSQQRGIFRR